MGAKKKADPRGKKKKKKVTPENISRVVAELSDPEATAVARVRSIASAFDLEKVVDILDSSEEVMATVRTMLKRDEDRYTLAEAAEQAGLTVDQFAQLNLACGFANPEPDARVFTDEDVRILQLFQASAEVFGEDVAIQNVRVIGSAMSRVAEAFISSFAVSVGRASQRSDFSDEDFMKANEDAIGMLPAAVSAMDVLLRRHIEVKSRSDIPLGDEWKGVDAVDRAVAFCDLVGYTSLAQQLGTTRLATILRAFETTASDLITSRGANVVKLIGDEVMFVASDAGLVADIALDLCETFDARNELPPVRCGLSAGSVIIREGDFHGPVVNMAARVVKLAPPSAVVAPNSIADQLADVTVEDYGTRELKGFEDPIALIRISR